MASSIIRNFIAKKIFQQKGAIANRKSVDFSANALEQRLKSAGINPNDISSEKELNQVLSYVKQAEDAAFDQRYRVISGDTPEGRKITEGLFGKRGEVVDMAGKKLDTSQGIMGGKSVKELMDSGQVIKGARGMKKSKKVQDREMFQDANKRLKTDVNKIIADIKAMDPMDSMKEANSVIGRKGVYKNLTPEESKKILKDTEDHIFERDIPIDPEDMATGGRAGFKGGGLTESDYLKVKDMLNHYFDYRKSGGTLSKTKFANAFFRENNADGGVAGLLGERTGFQGGGASYKSSSKSSKSKSKSSTSKGPAGGASAGGNYGGNVNPNQTYAGRTLSQRPSNYGGTGPSTTSGGGGGPPGTNTGGGTTTTPTLNRGFLSDVRKINQQKYLNLLKTMKPDDFSTDSILDDTTGLSDEDLNFLSRYGAGKVFKDLSKTNIDNFFEINPKGIAPKVKDLEMDVDRPRQYDFAELSKTQLDFLNSPKIQRDLKEFGREPKAVFDMLPNYEERRPSILSPFKKQEPTTPEEYNQYLDSIGVPRMTAADGGPARQNFAMGKRAFLKLMGGVGAGIAGLKSGLFTTGGKKAAVKEVVKQSAGSGTPPPYFFKLAEKIKKLGSDTTPTNDRTVAKSLKSKDGKSDYILEEDVASGDTIIKKVNKEGDEMITDVQIMELRKGEVVRGKDGKPKKTPDEYEEVTEANARIEGDVFNDPYYSDGIEIDDILREVDDIPVPKASGGIARMLGE